MAAKHEWPEIRCFVRPEVHKRLRLAAENRGTTMDLVLREAIECGLQCAERSLIGTGAGTGTGAR